jgi:nucleotide-binding universal stress UspA family protein
MTRSLIVHPTDLRAASEGAFHHALKIALAGRSRLTLAHVHTYGSEDAPNIEAYPHVRGALVRWGLLPEGAAQAEVSEKLGLYVSKTEVLAADAESGLAHMLQSQNAAMVVVGTRGLTGLQRLFDRSFSERLARDAKVPALFVPDGARGFVDGRDGSVRLRTVLVPVAQDPGAAGAVQAAAGLAGLLGQECVLHLLHVGRPGDMPSVTLAARAPTREIVREGPVVETIDKVAEEIDADLIVMATAGHKGFLDALRGSTTEGVVRTARRPVLAVPAS